MPYISLSIFISASDFTASEKSSKMSTPKSSGSSVFTHLPAIRKQSSRPDSSDRTHEMIAAWLRLSAMPENVAVGVPVFWMNGSIDRARIRDSHRSSSSRPAASALPEVSRILATPSSRQMPRREPRDRNLTESSCAPSNTTIGARLK